MRDRQGTMIAMAAALPCKGQGPDALFLINVPYALDDKVTDTMMSGDARPTNQARLTTLENLVRQIEQRAAAYVPEPTDHSSLPQHTAFMARVVAYDLPIGFCDSYEDKPFWKELKQEADWVLGKDPYYLTGALDVPGMPGDVISETVAAELSRRGKDGG